MKKYILLGFGLVTASVLSWIMFSGGNRFEAFPESMQRIGRRLMNRPDPAERYGIDLKNLYLCTDVIRANESLGEIMSRNGIPGEVVQELMAQSEGVLDLRKIIPGKSYCIMRSLDTLHQPQYFIYEQDPVNYVVYDLGEEASVKKHSKKVTRVTRGVSGVINSSLWGALEENDLNPELANGMASIYAWSIDFFRLQKGDHFKLLFEDQQVDGQSIGVGEIKAALFNHRGEDYYAIRYAQDTMVDFFDQNAKSLRKSFLKAPLEFRRISSHFNKKRFHPVLKRARPHLGTDYAAAHGTPIWTVGNGTVLRAEFNRGNGNFVEIKHNDSYTTKYLHMSAFGPGIRKGATVTQGQVIGYVGTTGLSTGPHLHFELIKNGTHIDAMTETAPPGDPIQADCMDAFAIYRDQIMAQLNAIPEPVRHLAQAGRPAARR
jgi:murein DD-endopeptidase MepM/ murein hydrolase activator NlpD